MFKRKAAIDFEAAVVVVAACATAAALVWLICALYEQNAQDKAATPASQPAGPAVYRTMAAASGPAVSPASAAFTYSRVAHSWIPHGQVVSLANDGPGWIYAAIAARDGRCRASRCGLWVPPGETRSFEIWPAPGLDLPSTGITYVDAVDVTPQDRAFLGDINGDGYVDVVDLLYLVDDFGKVTTAGGPADFNADGAVDVEDLLDLANNFGAGGTP